MTLDFSARFYRKLSKHPGRTLADGIVFIVLFQAIRFWVRQAGIYSSLKIPVSLFSPVIGFDMFTGPIIEILNSFVKIETWKFFVFGFLVCVGLFEFVLLCIFKSNDLDCENKMQIFLRLTRLTTFILVPLFFLPTSYDSTETCIYSVLAYAFTYSSLRFMPKEIQTITLLVGVLFTLLSWKAFFYEGFELYKTCPSQVTLIMKEQKEKAETGCWISSSDKYIVLMQGGVDAPRPQIIPRDTVSRFLFLERAVQK